MYRDEKTLWDRRYREGSHSSLEPDSFLADAYSRFLAQRSPGDALDVAGGAGRNALWLAHRGWQVRLIDGSEAGIALANENARILEARTGSAAARRLSGRIETQLLDLNSTRSLGQSQYDLILVFFYLQRALFPALSAGLKPRGLLIYKTYTIEQQRFHSGPRNPDYLLQPGELQEAFRSLRVLHYQERLASAATAELVAEKPARPK
jgi:SAM-dependent methyltransferase